MSITVMSLLLLITPCLASVFKADMDVSVSSSETINQNAYFAGNIISVNGDINGDLITAGNIVEVNGNIDGDLWVGANTISINGNITGDVRCGASMLTINGDVGGEVLAGAGLVNINEGSTVGEINTGTASLLIAGTVIGNVTASAENVTVKDTASIGGNLNYTSNSEALIEDSDVIVGTIQQNQPSNSMNHMKSDFYGDFLWTFTYFGIFMLVMGLIAKLLVGYVLLKISEKSVKNMVKRMNNNSFDQILKGFAFLVLLPIAAVIGLITVIGAPLSIMGLAVYGLALYIAKIIAAFWLGKKLMDWLKAKDKPVMLELLVGILALEAINWIPFVGWFISLLVWLLAIGALCKQSRESFEQCKKKKIC